MKCKEIQEKEKINLKLQNKKKVQKLKEKGITLIALVVTIIILLILAGVTLNMALSGDGLFSMARKAATDTKKASEEETKILSTYEFEMEKISGNVDENETYGEYAMEKEIKEKYGQEIKIGDQVNYNPKVEEADEEVSNYDGTWKVLGIEDGKILLMSSKKIKSVSLSGPEGYQKVEETLNEICEKYGKGTGAESARCLKVEDINRITGYDPGNAMNEEVYGKGRIDEYGNKIECKLKDGIVTISGSNGESFSKDASEFMKPDGTKLNSDGTDVFEFVSDMYTYFVRSAVPVSSVDAGSYDFSVSDSRWEDLFPKKSIDLWLANRTIGSNGFDVCYGVRLLAKNYGNRMEDYPCVVGRINIFTDKGSDKSDQKGVMCVVKLKDDVRFAGKTDSVWQMEV